MDFLQCKNCNQQITAASPSLEACPFCSAPLAQQDSRWARAPIAKSVAIALMPLSVGVPAGFACAERNTICHDPHALVRHEHPEREPAPQFPDRIDYMSLGTSTTSTLVSAVPFNQTDWPVPQTSRKVQVEQPQNLLVTTLSSSAVSSAVIVAPSKI